MSNISSGPSHHPTPAEVGPTDVQKDEDSESTFDNISTFSSTPPPMSMGSDIYNEMPTTTPVKSVALPVAQQVFGEARVSAKDSQ